MTIGPPKGNINPWAAAFTNGLGGLSDMFAKLAMKKISDEDKMRQDFERDRTYQLALQGQQNQENQFDRTFQQNASNTDWQHQQHLTEYNAGRQDVADTNTRTNYNMFPTLTDQTAERAGALGLPVNNPTVGNVQPSGMNTLPGMTQATPGFGLGERGAYTRPLSGPETYQNALTANATSLGARQIKNDADQAAAEAAIRAGKGSQADWFSAFNHEDPAQQHRDRMAEIGAGRAPQQSLLTPEGLQMAADLFKQTGVIPSLGRTGADRAAVVNTAAANGPANVAGNKANYQSDSASLKNVTSTLDMLTGFETAAGANLKVFSDAMKKLSDAGSPWINAPVRDLEKNALGDPDVAAANAARQVGLREVARVTNNPRLTGIISDDARKEVMSLIPQSATLAQIDAVLKVLHQDMANVKVGLSSQRDVINGRIQNSGAGGNTASAAPSAVPIGTTRVVGGVTYTWDGQGWHK